MKTNPMPMRSGPSVNVVEEANDQELIESGGDTNPISIIGEQLLKHVLIPINHDDFKDCVSNPGNFVQV